MKEGKHGRCRGRLVDGVRQLQYVDGMAFGTARRAWVLVYI